MLYTKKAFFPLLASAALIVLIGVITVSVPSKGYGGQPADKTPLDVDVVNTPLPVTGTLGVSGTIAATQSGAWNVGIDGTPKVKSADETTLIGSFVGNVPGGGSFTDAIGLSDVPWAKNIRVATNCFSGSACGNINVNVYSIVGSRSYLMDQFTMQNFLASTRVYDLLGTTVAVQLQNNNAGSIPNVGVVAFGRAN